MSHHYFTLKVLGHVLLFAPEPFVTTFIGLGILLFVMYKKKMIDVEFGKTIDLGLFQITLKPVSN